MRKSEILGLCWTDLDLREGLILLPRTKNGDRREIPMNQTVRATFDAIPRRLDGGRIFCDRQGRALKRIDKSFIRAVAKAGLADCHFHDMRHTFASQLVMAGIDLTTVKELLGHRDIKMTLRYAHLAPEHRGRVVEILDAKLMANYTKLYNQWRNRST